MVKIRKTFSVESHELVGKALHCLQQVGDAGQVNALRAVRATGYGSVAMVT
jgi:hypothetical protein